MNNLRKFATEAEYSAATLNYPAVSWVVSGDTVHYDKTSGSPTPVVNDKFMMAFTASHTGTNDIVLWNVGATDSWGILSSMTINDVAIESPSLTYALEGYSVVSGQSYVVKYGIMDGSDTYVSECLTGDLGGGWGSDSGQIDFLVPSQVTEISYLPSNIGKLVVEATTPPDFSSYDTSSWADGLVYVPDTSVDAYKAAVSWITIANYIHPISEYDGILPI